MSLLRLLIEGLGGPARETEGPVVWIDCAEVGLADIGRARADLVIVPEWGRRCDVVRWALAQPAVRVVVEYEASDGEVAAVLRGARAASARWDDGPSGRRVSVRPSAMRSRLVRDGT